MSNGASAGRSEGSPAPTLEDQERPSPSELAQQPGGAPHHLAPDLANLQPCSEGSQGDTQRAAKYSEHKTKAEDPAKRRAALAQHTTAQSQQGLKVPAAPHLPQRRGSVDSAAPRRISGELSRVFVALTAATAHAKAVKRGAGDDSDDSSSSSYGDDDDVSDTDGTDDSDDDGDEQLREAVRGEIIKAGCRPFPDFDEGTFTYARLVKKEILKYLTTAEAPFPDVLAATAWLLGPYGGRAPSPSGRAEQPPAALEWTAGAPLLTWSARNMLCMPKAMEASMDKGEWVLEPVLPDDAMPQDLAGAAQATAWPAGWEPTLWRVKCLVPADVSSSSAEKDRTRIDTTLQHDNRKLVTEAIEADAYGRRGTKVTQHLVPLAHFRNRTVAVDWSRVSMRALVVAYLFTLWTRVDASGVQDHALFTAGVARVREWMAAIQERQPAAGMEQQAARSLERIKEWFATLAVDGALDKAPPPPPQAPGGPGDERSRHGAAELFYSLSCP